MNSIRSWFDWSMAIDILSGTGRVARSTYWLGLAGILLCAVCLGFSLALRETEMPPPWVGFGAILLFVSWSSLIVRRSHDFDVPGWITLPLLIVWSSVTANAAGPGSLVGVTLQLMGYIAIGLLPGDSTENRYGWAPKPPKWPANRSADLERLIESTDTVEV